MTFAEFPLSPFANLTVWWWVPLAAILLDYFIGDPPSIPHPVRWVGALLAAIEPRARRLVRSPFLAGAAAACFALATTFLVVRLLLAAPSVLGAIAAVYLCFAGLALGQLLREGNRALATLEAGDLPAARRAVGYLVSRDVSGSGHAELCRVLAETLSENLNDAVIAPFFWLAFGGPVGLWLYKTASTMDSMWGYPHEPWTRFGTFAARLDDVLAFIPARLTALFLFFAAQTLRIGDRWPGFGLARKDAATMKSPNAGWPMAACAWILQAAMGGRAVYAGKVVEKPVLGPPGTGWNIEKLHTLISLLAAAGYSGMAFLWCAGFAFWLVIS